MPADVIARLRGLHEKATRGPWHQSRSARCRVYNADERCVSSTLTRHADAALIAAMRNALPALLDLADEVSRVRRRYAYARDGEVPISGLDGVWRAIARLDGGEEGSVLCIRALIDAEGGTK